MSDPLVFSTAGAWGAGIGTLTPTQFDRNFWSLFESIQGFIFEILPLSYTGIQSLQLASGFTDEFTVTLTNGHSNGPFELPYQVWNDRGQWQSNTVYAVNDVVQFEGSAYQTVFAHTSRATFAAGANDGKANDFYKLIMTFQDDVLPQFGDAGDALAKFSDANWDMTWSTTTTVAASLPAGGFIDAVLTKHSSADYDDLWREGTENVPSAPVVFPEVVGSHDFFPEPTSVEHWFDYLGAHTLFVMIPLDPHDLYPIATEFHFRQMAGGGIQVEADSGVTLNGIVGYHDQTGTPGAVITLKKVAAEEWDLFGLLAA